MRKYISAFFLTVFLTLTACHSSDRTLKIASTPVPHADLLEQIKPELEKEGIELKIIEVDDYNLPNRLLYEKQVDANFFQHEAFLEEQNSRFGFNLVPLATVHLEPMGIYSQKLSSLDSLKEGSLVALPNDPTNEGRALKLLEESGLITLRPQTNILVATPLDIAENPKKLKFVEIDAPFLPRALRDVDIALIPANFALQSQLDPRKDALVLESHDSPYVNIIAVRGGEENQERFLALKRAANSEKLRRYIEEKYKGSILPAF